MAVDSKFLKDPEGKGVVINYSRDEPRFTEENARNTILDLKRHPNFFEDIRLLSQRAGLAAPPVIIITDINHDHAKTNAAAGKNYYQKNVMEISAYSLQSLERDELNWLISHEVAHLVKMERPKSGLQKAMDAGREIKNNFFSFMKAALSSGHSSWGAENPLRKAAGAVIIAGVKTTLMMTDFLRDSMSINAKILSLSFKRKEESRADRASILLTGDADAGIRALNIILQEENSRGLWAGMMPSLLATHPHTKQRIKDLERFRDRHPDELQKSRTSLDELRGRMKRDFAAAHDRAPAVPEANPAAPEARSQSLRVSPGPQPGSRHS